MYSVFNTRRKGKLKAVNNFHTFNVVGEHTYQQNCPFGGAPKIVIKKDERGINLGKCELAERLWMIWREASPLTKFGNRKSFAIEMGKQGCPCPPYYSLFGGWRKRCKYNFGNWVRM